jgi:hypothetical protein
MGTNQVYFDRTSDAVSYTNIVTSPGNAAQAITVGSFNIANIWTDSDDRTFELGESNGIVSSYSAAGPRIDGLTKPEVLAPGLAIATTLSSDASANRSLIHKDGRHTVSMGTSFSAPQIAGLVALMFQVNPTLTSDQIKQIFYSSGSIDQALRYCAKEKYGYGKIDGLTTLLSFLKIEYLPIDFLHLTASIKNSNSAYLQWTRSTERNISGYEILRKTQTTDTFEIIDSYKHNTSLRSNTDCSFQFSDTIISDAKYVIREVDGLGRARDFGIISVQSTSDVQVVSTAAMQFSSLLQNYPNPFNPSTICEFHVPQYGNVTLKIFDIIGREVATLVNSRMNPGSYASTFNGSKLTSGTYFAQLTVQPQEGKPFIQTQKMLLTK